MSPIEQKLYAALMGSVPVEYTLHDLISDGVFGDGDDYAVLAAQEQISSYRADFTLTANGGARLVVECDGHDFHDRTKQQAAYDRARDRELLAMGIQTMRFTGSEIHHSPERCAAEVWKVFALVVAADSAPLDAFHHGFACAQNPPVSPAKKETF